VTDRTYPIPAQQQLHTSNGSPSTLIQRRVRFVSHPNRPLEGVLPFVVPAAASSPLREPAQTLRYPAAALCGCTDESPSAWIPSRLPLGTAARRWQSNFSAIAPNLRSRSALPLLSALPRWTTPTLPPPSPSRRAPGSTPYSATLPIDAPNPMCRSNNDPARHGRSTDEPRSNKSHSAHGYASGPIPSRQQCEE
jgi:hypothetical protein